jgi:hypothetical protein
MNSRNQHVACYIIFLQQLAITRLSIRLLPSETGSLGPHPALLPLPLRKLLIWRCWRFSVSYSQLLQAKPWKGHNFVRHVKGLYLILLFIYLMYLLFIYTVLSFKFFFKNHHLRYRLGMHLFFFSFSLFRPQTRLRP